MQRTNSGLSPRCFQAQVAHPPSKLTIWAFGTNLETCDLNVKHVKSHNIDEDETV